MSSEANREGLWETFEKLCTVQEKSMGRHGSVNLGILLRRTCPRWWGPVPGGQEPQRKKVWWSWSTGVCSGPGIQAVVISSCWKPRDFRKLSSGLIEYLGGGRKVYISNSNLRVNTCVKIGNSKKGRDGKTRNKFSLLILASCIKPAIIMSWVLLADHEDSWMIGLIANAARSTGRKNGISFHSLVLQGEDGSHSLDFLLRGEESQTSLRLTPETVLRTLEQPLANNYGPTLKRLAREKSSLALK